MENWERRNNYYLKYSNSTGKTTISNKSRNLIEIYSLNNYLLIYCQIYILRTVRISTVTMLFQKGERSATVTLFLTDRCGFTFFPLFVRVGT